jgi:hypothetical protein
LHKTEIILDEEITYAVDEVLLNNSRMDEPINTSSRVTVAGYWHQWAVQIAVGWHSVA